MRGYDRAAAAAKLLQSCPTLCDPIDGSPRGSPVPGILQARTRWSGRAGISKFFVFLVKKGRPGGKSLRLCRSRDLHLNYSLLGKSDWTVGK